MELNNKSFVRPKRVVLVVLAVVVVTVVTVLFVIVVVITVAVTVKISSAFVLRYEIRFVGFGQVITNNFGSINRNTVFGFRVSPLVYSGTTV
jgi:hypothetical protein